MGTPKVTEPVMVPDADPYCLGHVPVAFHLAHHMAPLALRFLKQLLALSHGLLGGMLRGFVGAVHRNRVASCVAIELCSSFLY